MAVPAVTVLTTLIWYYNLENMSTYKAIMTDYILFGTNFHGYFGYLLVDTLFHKYTFTIKC